MTPDHTPSSPEASLNPVSAGVALQEDAAKAGRLTWRASILVILALSASLWAIIWLVVMRLFF